MVSSGRHRRQGANGSGLLPDRRMVLGAAIAAGFVRPAHAETKWDLPLSSNGPTVPARQIRSFANIAARLSANELQINIHEAGRLMPPAEIKDAVRKGVISIGEITLSLHAGESPLYGLDTIPFVAMNFAEARKLYAVQRPLLEKRLADEGLILLASIPFTPLGLCARKPLTDIADLGGLRFRAYNSLTKKLALRSGGEAVPVETIELAQAFKSGTVDAFTASPTQAVTRKAAGYAPYFHLIGTWIPRSALVASKAAFDAIGTDERKAVLEAAVQAEEQGWQQAQSESAQSSEQLRAAGFSVIEPSADFIAGARRIGRAIAQDWLKDLGEDGAVLLDRYYQP